MQILCSFQRPHRKRMFFVPYLFKSVAYDYEKEIRFVLAARRVCVARRGHPVLHDESLSLEHYVELSHVQVLPRDATMFGDAVDTAIAAIGLIRRVVLWQPNFLAVGNVVSR